MIIFSLSTPDFVKVSLHSQRHFKSDAVLVVVFLSE